MRQQHCTKAVVHKQDEQARASLLVCFGNLPSRTQPRLLSMHQRHIHQVLAEEPDLQFIGPQHIADDKIVSAGVAQFVRTFR